MSPPPSRILVVEDEPEISSLIQLELGCEGYEVKVAGNGLDGLREARQWEPDLIILDRMLPGMDGLSVCRRLRRSSDVPVLMLTVLGEINDRVEGLDAGANDYLVKPFDLDELLARVRVQLRQRGPSTKERLEFTDLTMDLPSRDVLRGTQALSLSPTEYELLKTLMEYPRQVMTRHRLLQAVWGWDFEGEDNVLEVYIGYLRKKTEVNGAPRLIHTVRGIGYVLRETA